MAVEDKYVDANLEAGKITSALFSTGVNDTITGIATVAVAAADDDGSIYRLFSSVPSSLVPVKITVHNTAITAGTDYDLGLYEVGGAVVDADILVDGATMATARVIAVDNNVGMTTIAIADGAESLGELSAQTAVSPAYDIVLTANTVGTLAGTIRVTATFAYK